MTVHAKPCHQQILCIRDSACTKFVQTPAKVSETLPTWPDCLMATAEHLNRQMLAWVTWYCATACITCENEPVAPDSTKHDEIAPDCSYNGHKVTLMHTNEMHIRRQILYREKTTAQAAIMPQQAVTGSERHRGSPPIPSMSYACLLLSRALLH